MSRFGPLFHAAAADAQRKLAADFRRAPLGRLFREISRRGRSQRGAEAAMRVLHRVGGRPEAVRYMMGQRLGDISMLIERYARRGDAGGDLVRQWLESLGEPGQILLALSEARAGLPGTSQAGLLRSAIALIRAMGGEVLPDPQWSVFGPDPRATEAAWEYLRRTGELQRLQDELGGDEVPQEAVPRPRAERQVTVHGPGGVQNLAEDHPAVTGEFVPVASSNVHSVAYDADTATLYVRFLDSFYNKATKDYVRQGPGPIYAYYNVPPEMFLDMLHASSKGGWVWDHLRIRGTLSGHQRDYALVGIVRGYVPRKATFAPTEPRNLQGGAYAEMWVPRQVQDMSGQWISSKKPLEVVRTFRPTGPIPPGKAGLFGI